MADLRGSRIRVFTGQFDTEVAAMGSGSIDDRLTKEQSRASHAGEYGGERAGGLGGQYDAAG